MRIKNKLAENSEFAKNKLLWIEDNTTFSDTTKQVYLDFIILYAYPVEVYKGKDLYRFTSGEIIELFNNIPKIRERNASTLWSAINSYLSWAAERGLCPQGNPCDALSFDNLMKINVEAIKDTYIKLDYFWEKIYTYRIEYKIPLRNLAILVLFRYGVPNKYLPYLKFKDIDIDDNLLSVWGKGRKEVELLLTVDDNFIYFIKELIIEYEKDYIPDNFMSEDYILEGRDSKMINNNTIYSRYNAIYRNTKDIRMSINDLMNSRKYDTLYEIYNIKEYLTYIDVHNVYVQFVGKESSSGEFNLKEDFQIISDIHVYTKKECDRLGL